MCEQNAGQNHNIKMSNKFFQNVADFKQLGTALTNQNCMHKQTRGSLNLVSVYTIHFWIFCLLVDYTYLFTPWSRVLLEKLTVSQLVKKFPAFYGTRRFITAFTSTCHLSLSSARSIQSMAPHPTPEDPF